MRKNYIYLAIIIVLLIGLALVYALRSRSDDNTKSNKTIGNEDIFEEVSE